MRKIIKILILIIITIIMGCSNQYSSNKTVKDVNSIKPNIDKGSQYQISLEEMKLLNYFNWAFPNSPIIDRYYGDIDNDGFKELLLALNTYSGADKKQEKELIKK